MKLCLKHKTLSLRRYCPECRRAEDRRFALAVVRELLDMNDALRAANRLIEEDLLFFIKGLNTETGRALFRLIKEGAI